MVRDGGSRKARPRGTGESGQTILIVAVALVVLILAAGLAVDVGYLRYQKRLEQLAADSAAIAAANQITACNGTPPCAQMINAGQTNASYNGFDTSGATVSIDTPTDGAHVGDAHYVEAKITKHVSTFFVKVLGSSFSSYPVTAWAVAYPGPGTACMYALGPGGISTLTNITGPGDDDPIDIQAQNCGVFDDGPLSLPDASHCVRGTFIGTVGSYTIPCQQPSPLYDGSPPTLSTSIASTTDPLAYLAPPSGTLPPCAGQSTAWAAGVTTYPCGLVISGAVNLNPSGLSDEVYSIGGAGLHINAGSTVTGQGVTVYTTGSAAVNIDPGAVIQLSAPSDTGVLFFQDSNDTQPANIALSITASDNCVVGTPTTDAYATGALYFPQATLTLSVSPSDSPGDPHSTCAANQNAAYTIVDAYAIVVAGWIQLNAVPPNAVTSGLLTNGSPIKTGVLVE